MKLAREIPEVGRTSASVVHVHREETRGARGVVLARTFAMRTLDWPASSDSPRLRDLAREGVVRLSILLLYLPLMFQVLSDALATRRIAGLLFLCNASLIVLFTLIRRSTDVVDRSWPARAVTLAAVTGPLLFRPGGHAAVPDYLAGAVGCVGFALSIGGIVALRRSFGLIPANRGVVSSGLYRVVRHPIYAGYLVSHVAFLLTYPTLWNAVVWAISDGAQFVRVRYEEQLLRRDSAYASYVRTVRWRVLPGLY
jgi:protein-S-isoprenylcysteine O-methyltransferase Ste14